VHLSKKNSLSAINEQQFYATGIQRITQRGKKKCVDNEEDFMEK
jgi:hypothetical protein